jgi:hypothetical protein
MKRGKEMRIGVALIASTAAVLALAAVPAAATRTVNIPSGLKISVYAYTGKVTASNPACVGERAVVLKQKGHGVLGRTKSTATGKWEVPPESLHYKGPLPYKIYAELKPRSEGTAGTIYKCSGATSKTVTISGG